MRMNKQRKYGNITLSAQNDPSFHYCDGSTYEVAFMLEGRGIVTPDVVGLPQFMEYYDCDTVAGYVPLHVVEEMRAALYAMHGDPIYVLKGREVDPD